MTHTPPQVHREGSDRRSTTSTTRHRLLTSRRVALLAFLVLFLGEVGVWIGLQMGPASDTATLSPSDTTRDHAVNPAPALARQPARRASRDDASRPAAAPPDDLAAADRPRFDGGQAPRSAAPRRLTSAERRALWREVVGEALDRRIAEISHDRVVSPADRADLMAALTRVRRASRRAQTLPAEDHLAQAAQTRAIVKADQVFRDKLGVGIAEFVAAESAPGQIEDLGG